jgi:class 3 adenylate cyclase
VAIGTRILGPVIDDMLRMRFMVSARPARQPAPTDGRTARCVGTAVAVWRVGRAMFGLPRGTVTFLFTDVEGSTRLLSSLGDGYADLLAAHQRVLRDAINSYGGCEVGTQGDAFFVAFARARDAMAAAVAAQRGLATTRWPPGVEVRVRMGLHTGEAAVRGTTYVGLDVHRAARICSAAHGGQVLVSSATRELVAGATPNEEVMLRDLGLYALRDLGRPVHLFEVVAQDLAAGFAALRDGAARHRA